LGAAAERLITQTAEIIAEHYGDTATRKELEQCRNVKEVAAFITGRIKDLRKRHPDDPSVFGDFDTKIGTLYQFYRLTRNDTGHPGEEIPNVRAETLRANLESFLSFSVAVLRVWSLLE
jgi:hypothetical protein